MTSSAIGGAASAISTALRKFERSAARVASSDLAAPAAPDLVQETVAQMTAGHAVAANAAVIRTADQMTGALINIWA